MSHGTPPCSQLKQPVLLGIMRHPSLDVRCAECVFPLQIFMVSSSKIQARGYETLYQFATANERSLFGRVVLRAPMRLRVIVFCQFSCTMRPAVKT